MTRLKKNLFEIFNTIEGNKKNSNNTGFFNKLKKESLYFKGGTNESDKSSTSSFTSQLMKSTLDSALSSTTDKSGDDLTSQFSKSLMDSALKSTSGKSSNDLTSQMKQYGLDNISGKSDNLTAQMKQYGMDNLSGKSDNLKAQMTQSAMDSISAKSDNLKAQMTQSAMDSISSKSDNLTAQMTQSAMGSMLGSTSVDNLTSQKSSSLFSFIGKENNVLKEKNIPKEESKGFFGSIKSFFKSDYFFFIKNYLFFLVLFSICFYLLLFINDTSKIKSELVITKVFFYLIIIFLFIIIGDILETPLEYQNKLIMIIMFSLLIVYLAGYMIDKYYKKENFYFRLLKIFIASLIVYVITLIIIHYTLVKYDSNKLNQIYSNFSYGISKNIYFLIFVYFYLLFYTNIFYSLNLWNSKISEILGTSLLGLLLILFIFIFIIYITIKMKIITKIQILNAFIALSSIAVFLAVVYAKIFMSSLNTICETKVNPKDVDQDERIGVLLLISICIILWYDDLRNWHALGSLLFIIVTVFGLYCFLYYSTTHPSLGTLSIWFFIEWLIIIFYRKQNSKNAIHFSFMQI